MEEARGLSLGPRALSPALFLLGLVVVLDLWLVILDAGPLALFWVGNERSEF